LGEPQAFIWANWRALKALLEMQFKLKRKGLRPECRIEDSFHCATSIETPGFYKAVERGEIKLVRGTLSRCKPGHVITEGRAPLDECTGHQPAKIGSRKELTMSLDNTNRMLQMITGYLVSQVVHAATTFSVADHPAKGRRRRKASQPRQTSL
jgi:hypothetical protein